MFPEPAHSDTLFLSMTEPSVHWLTKSIAPEAIEDRVAVNAICERHPVVAERLSDDLHSTDDLNHAKALDELHVLARARTAVSVGYEEGGVGPDFRFYEPDGQYMGAIEAVSLAMRHDWEQKAAEHNHLVVGLNERLKLTRYYVGFEIVRADQAISVNKAAAFVSAVMESLPKDVPAFRDLSPLVYRDSGVEIEFTFMARTNRAEPRPGTPIVAFGPKIGGLVNSHERMRKSISQKGGSRYDLRYAGFGVALVARDPFLSMFGVMRALFGFADPTRAVQAGDYPQGAGVFGTGHALSPIRNRRISSVFIMLHVRPAKWATSAVIRVDNPGANYALPNDLLSVDATLRPTTGADESLLRWSPKAPSDQLWT